MSKLLTFFSRLLPWFFSSQTPSAQQSQVFNFTAKPSQLFGTVYQPLIKVMIWSDKFKRWLAVPMIVDTGADYSILPKFLATEIGLDLNQDAQLKPTTGVGGDVPVYFYPQLKVKLGQLERTIPVGFVMSNSIPALMGRQAFLETLQTELIYRDKIIFKN